MPVERLRHSLSLAWSPRRCSAATGGERNPLLHREHGCKRHPRGARFVRVPCRSGRPGRRCQPVSSGRVAELHRRRRAATNRAPHHCKRLPGGTGDSACFSARRGRRRPRRVEPCARREKRFAREGKGARRFGDDRQGVRSRPQFRNPAGSSEVCGRLGGKGQSHHPDSAR